MQSPLYRPAREDVWLQVAKVIASRSTCRRRQVGCVLLDQHYRVLGTGYNGVPRGMVHCTSEPCPGANLPSAQGLELCEAVHAEQNALLQCKDTDAIYVAVVTAFPCMHCLKILANTPNCMEIWFKEKYGDMGMANRFWRKSREGRTWCYLRDV